MHVAVEGTETILSHDVSPKFLRSIKLQETRNSSNAPHYASIHRHTGSRHVARTLGGEKRHDVSHLFRPSKPLHRNIAHPRAAQIIETLSSDIRFALPVADLARRFNRAW